MPALSAVRRQSIALTASVQDSSWWSRFWKGFTGGAISGLPPTVPGITGGTTTIPGVSPGDVAGGVAKGAEKVVGSLLPDWQKLLIRVGAGLAGVALVAVGANMLVKKSDLAQSAKSIATLVATKGAA